LWFCHGYAKSPPMPTDQTATVTDQDESRQKGPLSPAAERALAEAAARRAEQQGHAAAPSKEVGGRDRPDPTRYGDWEVNGLASDF
jgi:hypothetical protein